LKILAPASSAREAEHLISCGARELYCGLHPGAGAGKSGAEWINRRGPGPANIGSTEELKRVADFAGARGVPVFLTLNLPFYSPEQYPAIAELAGEAASCGITAFIIGDPGLIIALGKDLPGVAIHVSSLAAVLNSASVTFFRDLGASRIIFPRYMGLEELGRIVAKTGPATEYEVFMLNDGCVFEEGYCHASHAFGGAFCHQPWLYRPLSWAEGPAPGQPFQRHLEDHHRWRWFIKNCGGFRDPGGAPLGMCGLCAIPDLQAMGVTSLKIVGREAPLQKKMASVKLIKQVLDMAEAGHDAATVKNRARRLRGVPELCASGYMCYFR
jgi:collagenase-like PrtC family protease